MKLVLFDTHRFEKEAFGKANAAFGHEIRYLEPRLTAVTASLARGSEAVCVFANCKVDRAALEVLKSEGVRLVALRSAGFNHVDLKAARELGLPVVRVPEYSPYSVAEHAMCLLLALNRKVHRAHARVREGNFSLEGLVGFDFHGKTVGVVGTGRIGAAFARIALGFGCKVLAYDVHPNVELQGKADVRYVPLTELFAQSDLISLHVPLTSETHHLVNADAFESMKTGAFLVNTGRGALVDTKALVEALKSGKLGAAGLDVYEEEEKVFFRDLSDQILQDDQLARLMTFPNVLITSHQGFLTREALENIAHATLQSVADFAAGRPLVHRVEYK